MSAVIEHRVETSLADQLDVFNSRLGIAAKAALREVVKGRVGFELLV